MTTLTEGTLRSTTSAQSFERGLEYYHSGAVYNTIRQGDTLLAECVGTETYHLRVELDAAGVRSARCTCPYEYGGYCKHLVALLLTYLHKPDEFTERKSLPVLLENVDKTALVAMLAKLADRHPELYNWIETSLPVAVVATKSIESQSKPVSQVSEQAWRKRIKNVLRPGRGYYDDYESSYSASSDLDEITNSASEVLAAGDAQGAIAILLALLDELGDAYEMFDDSDGELGESADFAGEVLAEAILSADLNEKERKTLERKLAPIAKNLADYGIEDGLEIAQLALEHGWETHPEYVNDFTTNLDKAKLNVLERQGRTDEFLALCQQTGQHLRYTQKLLQLGRTDEGIRAAYQLAEPTQVLETAKKLREANLLSDAIPLAEHGLTSPDKNTIWQLGSRHWKNPKGGWKQRSRLISFPLQNPPAWKPTIVSNGFRVSAGRSLSPRKWRSCFKRDDPKPSPQSICMNRNGMQPSLLPKKAPTITVCAKK